MKLLKHLIIYSLFGGLGFVSTVFAETFNCPFFEDYSATEIELATAWIRENRNNEHRILLVGELQVPELGVVQNRHAAVKSAEMVAKLESDSERVEHIRHIDEAYLFVGHSVDKQGVKTSVELLGDHHGICEIGEIYNCYGYLPYSVKMVVFTDAKAMQNGQFIEADNCPSFVLEPTELLTQLYTRGMRIKPKPDNKLDN